jgi:AcrR family transcriptional regulator
VLDVVLEMFAEEALMPSIEEASRRSGLSLRSVYRYFADPDELLEAAIERSLEQSLPLAHIHAIGQGSFENRLDTFIESRIGIYEHAGPTYRATIHTAWRHTRLRESLADTRRLLRQQLELQFATELERHARAERKSVLAAADTLTQLDAIDYLRGARRFSVAETAATVRTGLTAVLTNRN